MKERKVEKTLKQALNINPPERVWENIKNEPIMVKQDIPKKKNFVFRYAMATACCAVVLMAATVFTKNLSNVSIISDPNVPTATTQIAEVEDSINVNLLTSYQPAKINANVRNVNYSELREALKIDLTAFNSESYQYSLLYGITNNDLLGAIISDEQTGTIVTISVNPELPVTDIEIENETFSTINKRNVFIFNFEKTYLATFNTDNANFCIESSSLNETEFVSYLKNVM